MVRKTALLGYKLLTNDPCRLDARTYDGVSSETRAQVQDRAPGVQDKGLQDQSRVWANG